KKGGGRSSLPPLHASRDPKRIARRYRQVLLAPPLHLFEQQSEFTLHDAPLGLQLLTQDGWLAQFESAQSVAPSQSLSMPSVQTSVVGVQVAPRNGWTDGK